MATGDDALAAGMDILNGNERANTLDTEMNKTRDYIAQRTSTITPVAKGGTGAATPQGARTNLGIPEIAPANSAEAGKLPTYSPDAQLATGAPTLNGHAASKQYVDRVDDRLSLGISQLAARPVGVPSTGGIFTGAVQVNGNFHLPNSVAASSGYTVAYINGDGRVSRGASSERYKKYISAIDPDELGDIWPNLVRYQMRSGDGTWKYGYIAERLDASDDLRPFVVYREIDGETLPDSIDFIALLMAQNAQLHQRLQALEDRT